MVDDPLRSRDRLPLRAVVRYVGYKGWWWHVEDAQGQLTNWVGARQTDITEPDGVAARGRARTQRGAKAKAERARKHAEQFFPPEGGWRQSRYVTVDGDWEQANDPAA